MVLLGPSGSGKSTILSIIAGFEPQNSGDVFIDGNNCNKKPCQDRDVAMVFQNYALYPCMNVYNNIAFPLINRHEKKEIVNQKVRTIAKTLHIEDILKKKVDKISGGQKQRVAIGRAFFRFYNFNPHRFSPLSFLHIIPSRLLTSSGKFSNEILTVKRFPTPLSLLLREYGSFFPTRRIYRLLPSALRTCPLPPSFLLPSRRSYPRREWWTVCAQR